MRPSRRPRLGQNFLSSPRTAGRIVDALAAEAGSWVLEVGPGRGALTRPLLSRGIRVLAVEIDGLLAARLTAELGCELLRVIEADALRFDPAAALAEAGAAPPSPSSRTSRTSRRRRWSAPSRAARTSSRGSW